MLAAAAPTANAAPPAHDFGNQPFNIISERKKVTVAAVVAEHNVSILEGFGNGNADHFLADTGVDRAKKLAGREQIEEPSLDAPDEHGFLELRQ
jgi:hypothetical protein